MKIRIHKIILPTVLCGRGTWSLTLRKNMTYTCLETKFFGRIFGSKKEEVGDLGYYTRHFVIYTRHLVLYG